MDRLEYSEIRSTLIRTINKTFYNLFGSRRVVKNMVHSP